MVNCRSFSCCSWNVRGLGEQSKCDSVLSELLSMQVAIACLQETKLSSPDGRKTRSFLPSRLSSHCILDSIGAAGGVITAWDPNLFSLISVTRTSNTLSVTPSFNLDGSSLHVTNIYVPSADKTHFFSELRSLPPHLILPRSFLVILISPALPPTKTTPTSPCMKRLFSTTPLTIWVSSKSHSETAPIPGATSVKLQLSSD